jgi:hypothetical protein
MDDFSEYLSNVPSWLAPGLVFPVEVGDDLRDASSNWVKLHSRLQTMDELNCKSLLVLELAGRRRIDIVARVLKQHNKLVAERTNNEIWDIVPKEDM